MYQTISSKPNCPNSNCKKISVYIISHVERVLNGVRVLSALRQGIECHAKSPSHVSSLEKVEKMVHRLQTLVARRTSTKTREVSLIQFCISGYEIVICFPQMNFYFLWKLKCPQIREKICTQISIRLSRSILFV